MSGKQPGALRCAIYTRKSTSEGLDSDFSTLDAQRDAGEIYVKSQASLGWVVVPTRYDDGGFTGANMERPALRRLLGDIDRGLVDCVVVYKVDRLSRSLIDFARMMEQFEKKGISCVSTTQQFNTATPIGRFTLHILLSFAQFEREMISERTRDKVAAARRRGKWTGGHPVLGYQTDDALRKLEVIPEEAEQVREIFELYLKTGSMGEVVKQLDQRGWTKKCYVTKAGKASGGGPFSENVVHRILRNPLYTGAVPYKGKQYEGEHEAIIEKETFDRVQAQLASKQCGRGKRRRRNFDYLLQGVIYCQCGCKMTSASGRGQQGHYYRYYRCYEQRRGLTPCFRPRVSAEEVEAAVVDRIRQIGADQELQRLVAERLSQSGHVEQARLRAEAEAVDQQAQALNKEAEGLLTFVRDNGGKGGSLVSERLGSIELELATVRARQGELEAQRQAAATAAQRAESGLALLRDFTEVWDVLVSSERCELVKLLVQRVQVNATDDGLKVVMYDLAATLAEDEASSEVAEL